MQFLCHWLPVPKHGLQCKWPWNHQPRAMSHWHDWNKGKSTNRNHWFTKHSAGVSCFPLVSHHFQEIMIAWLVLSLLVVSYHGRLFWDWFFGFCLVMIPYEQPWATTLNQHRHHYHLSSLSHLFNQYYSPSTIVSPSLKTILINQIISLSTNTIC